MKLKKLLIVFFKKNSYVWRRISPYIFILCNLLLNNLAQATHFPLADFSDTQTIIQDKKGFIWVAGQHGLTRFDGTSGINFSKHDNQWNIPYSWINHISTHGDNFLIATENQGAWLFNPIHGKSIPIPIDTESSTLYKIIHHQNSYYIYGRYPNQLYQYVLSSQKTKKIGKEVTIKNIVKTNKFVYFTSERELFRINSESVEKIRDISSASIVSSDDSVYIAHDNKIFSYQDGGKFSSLTLSENIKNMTMGYHKKHIIAITNTGLIYKLDSITLAPLEHGYKHIDMGFITSIYEDNQGVLWLNNSQGIKRAIEDSFKNHPYQYHKKNNTLQVTVLNKQIVLGSYGAGLHEFSSNSLLPVNVNQEFTNKGKIITDILTHKNVMYITTFDGLWRFDLLSQELTKEPLFPDKTILLSLNHKKNKLYIGSDSQGVFIYDMLTNTILNHIEKSDGLSSNEIIDVLPLQSNNLWVATAKGVDKYSITAKKITQLETLGHSKVYSLTYAHNKIFAATQSDGIYVYNHQGILLEHFAQHIEFHSIKYIDNAIWAPSSHGIYKINPQNNKIALIANTEKYSFTDSPVKLEDTLYIPHSRGVLEIPIGLTEHYDAKVHISHTTVSGQTYLKNKKINLISSNDIVLLNIASLDYRLGSTKRYQYKINDGQWTVITGNNITLTGLLPGVYRITIKGTNSLGEWSSHYAHTEIHVAYPWYWSPQIRMLYIAIFIAICLITLWLLYLRFKSIKHIHHLLSQDIKIRGKSSINVAKNLSRVVDLIQESKKFIDKDSVYNDHAIHLQKITAIVKDSMSELEAQAASKEPDGLYGKSLSIALPYLVQYIHDKYHINVQTKYDINEKLLSYDMQADIYKIIYEALIASITNGDGRSFSLSIQEFKQKLWITINDDSDSFVHYKNKINFDMSMYYIRQIAKKYSASVNTFHDKERGSQLMISFPLMSIS